MNKVILIGRLSRDPELRYTNGNQPLAVARYSLAVNRRFKRDGEPDVDFINCVAFGKAGEFAEKYFRKGQQISVVGRLQVRSWEDKNGQKRSSTDVIIEEQYFAESKRDGAAASSNAKQNNTNQENGGFYPVETGIDDDLLPF